ncbi:MAG: ArsR/SmtB family transcription factor [Reyranellaceae bacterium]
MKIGPDIAVIASLVGDPARANMLTALMGGKALSAGELAAEAGVSLQTASSHLAKLQGGGLLAVEKQGRHRYYRLTGQDIAQTLESMMGLAARVGHLRTQPGPKDPALRHARVCYDHLAGDQGVRLLDSLRQRRFIRAAPGRIELTAAGADFVAGFGIDLDRLKQSRRLLCRACLDWSVRRPHLAGALGAALLQRLTELGWARREASSRAIAFSRAGEIRFERQFPLRQK